MVIHVVHVQPAQDNKTWCGLQYPAGIKIVGVENFVYYTGTGPVCAKCVDAIIDAFGTQVAKAREK